MKIAITFLCTFIFSATAVFSQLDNLSVSDQNVSRLALQTKHRNIVSISRVMDKNKSGDIMLQQTDRKGKIMWTQVYGGSGYEYIGSFTKSKDGGYIIVGTTSSFGEGNNDVYLVKVDEYGQELWSKTYGGFFNEYGKYLKENSDGSLIVKAKKQFCEGDNVGNCQDKEWTLLLDRDGQLLEDKVSAFKNGN